MPTGYTAKLCEQDVDFNEFVMTCAKAMGACVMLRDEPFDAPIPDRFEPSSHHADQLKGAQEMLAKVTAMTAKDCGGNAEREYTQELERARQRIAETQAARDRLNALKEKVVQWKAPTDDHAGLKKFMLEQINTTLDYDGNDSYHQGRIKELRQLSPEEWRQRAIAKWLKEIDYHAAEHRKEVERTEARNEWIKALRASLARAGTEQEKGL